MPRLIADFSEHFTIVMQDVGLYLCYWLFHTLITDIKGSLPSLSSSPHYLTKVCPYAIATFISSVHEQSLNCLGDMRSKLYNESAISTVMNVVYEPTAKILQENGVSTTIYHYLSYK